MRAKVQRLSTSTSRVRIWRWAVSGIVLVATAATLWWSWQTKLAPPPPVVDTSGFDPEIASAIAQARAAAQSAPSSSDARGHLGMVLLAHDVRGPAAECFSQASSMAPREPRWLYLLGLTQLPNDPAQAATNFDRAVRLFPDDQLIPRLRLADTLLSLGRLPEADALYRQVLKSDPGSALARLGLGKIASAQGELAQAAQDLGAATDDPNTRKAARRLLLNVDQRLGHTNEAEQLAQSVVKLPFDNPFPDPILAEVQSFKTGEAAWIDTSDDLIKAGRLTEATQLLERTAQTYPKSDRALFLLGRARSRLGDLAGAETVLQQATTLAPGSVEAQIQLGIVQLARGRTQEAQRSFRAAIQAKPNLAEAWFNLGLSLGGENPSGAAAAFSEALRLKPNFPEASLGSAMVLRAQGQVQAAANELQRALALHPDEAMRQKLLAQLNRTQPQ